MLMPLYLISSVTNTWATAIAADMLLHRQEWVWVPTIDAQKRKEVLSGMRVESQTYLLGYFSPWEIRKLTGDYR